MLGWMGQVVDAARTFFDHLASVGWTALGIAVGMHVARLLCRAIAWRAILAAAFPGSRVRLLPVAGAYVAGVGVNSVIPARGGDVLKMVLVRHRIAGSDYTTMAPTLLVETLFDLPAAACILGWAFTQNVLPGLDVLPDLPAVDWGWPARHPGLATAIGLIWLICLVGIGIVWSRKVREFRARVRQGFAILREPRRYVLHVVTWQALSWVLRGATVWYSLEAFHLPATVRNTALVLAVQSLATLLPFTPGGVGTTQGFLVYVFRGSHLDKTALVGFSVGMHIATTVANVVLTVVALAWLARTLRWRSLIRRHEQETRAAGDGPGPDPADASG